MNISKRCSSDSSVEEPRKKAKSFDSDLERESIMSKSSDCIKEKKHFTFKKPSSIILTKTQSLTENGIPSHNRNTELLVGLNRTIKHKSLDGLEQVSPNKSPSRRKFPGPAGLLPDHNNSLRSEFQQPLTQSNMEEICSQGTYLKFTGPWEEMMADYPVEAGRINLLETYNIGWIKNRVFTKKLINQRTPFLAAFIHSINCNTSQNTMVNVVLKDKSGTIQGTISPKLYEQYTNELTVGSVLVLRQIGVLNAGSSAEPYLIITPKNLISIYANRLNSEKSQVTLGKISKIIVRNVSIDEIHKNINEMMESEKQLEKSNVLRSYGSSKNSENRTTNRNSFQTTPKLSSNESLDQDDNIEELMVQFLEETEKSSCRSVQQISDISKDSAHKCSNSVKINTSNWVINSTNTVQDTKDNSQILQDMFDGLDTNLLFDDF